MLTEKFIESLDLPPDKAAALRDAVQKDSFYRGILQKVGIYPAVIETIMRTVDASEIDPTQAELLTEKARIEWADFIPKTNNNRK